MNLSTLVLMLFSTQIIAQNTIGLISLKDKKVAEGYTMVYPHGQPHTFLLNNCGEIAHQWDGEEDFIPGNVAYLQPNGNIVQYKRDLAFQPDSIWPSAGSTLEIKDWNNNTIYTFEQDYSKGRLHHDIAPLPNGNVLLVSWERVTAQEAIAQGRDPSKIRKEDLWPDYILEVDPSLDSIVWEWHAMDHLIQDFDPTKPNYGVVSDHPELIDFNYDEVGGQPDWMHVNSLDYNIALDQIMLSVPFFNEVWIIDHSTTTEEATGHEGGKAGSGGDLLYRFGNPAAYRQGSTDDQILFFQHDAHWANQSLDETDKYYGNIVVFNNKVNPNYSTVEIFNPPLASSTFTYNMTGDKWMPFEFNQSIMHPDTFALASRRFSSAQILPNDNILICNGVNGYTFELDSNNSIVWEYITPLRKGERLTQGYIDLKTEDNPTFRAYKYPANFQAFEGKTLDRIGFIELEPDLTYCDQLIPTIDIPLEDITIYPNPTSDNICISNLDEKTYYTIYNTQGISIKSGVINSTDSCLDIKDLTQGLYYITTNKYKSTSFIKQ